MTEAEALDALIEAGTALLGIDADPAWQEQIRLHLRISLDHARNVASFPLPDETDPAPVCLILPRLAPRSPARPGEAPP